MESLITFIHHTVVLTSSELAEFFGRWKAILGIVLYVLIFGVSAYYLVEMQRHMEGNVYLLRESLSNPEVLRSFQQLGLAKVPQILAYLAAQPSGIWIFQVVGVIWYPLFITLLSFDCVATDTNRGTQRFIIQRASRASYLSSKFLAHTIFYVFLHLIASVVLVGAYWWWLPHVHIALPLMRYTAVMLAFITILVAATVFVSSFCSSAGKALIWVNLFWILTMIGGAFSQWLNPLRGEWITGLLMPANGYGIACVIGFGAWSLVLVMLALLRWEIRDL